MDGEAININEAEPLEPCGIKTSRVAEAHNCPIILFLECLFIGLIPQEIDRRCTESHELTGHGIDQA